MTGQQGDDKQAMAALYERYQQLEHLLHERTTELLTVQEQLQHARQQHQQMEAALEESVHARTQELAAKTTELEAALQQVQTMQQQSIIQEKLASLGALTAGIAHEIRNPLNFVNNFADLSVELAQELRDILLAQQDRFDPETLADVEDILESLDQNVQKIIEHGKRADRIVNGMLQHSRGQTGVREPTDLNALLGEYVNLAYHGMRAQDVEFNVSISMDLDPNLGMIDVIPHDMSRVFLNVVNNAFYAVDQKRRSSPRGFVPMVTVRTRDCGDRVEIGIRDNGPGISPEVQAKMFQPFFTTKAPGTGTGLGLSLSYDIVVQEHQGEIRVETVVGEGTELMIAVPRKAR